MTRKEAIKETLEFFAWISILVIAAFMISMTIYFIWMFLDSIIRLSVSFPPP